MADGPQIENLFRECKCLNAEYNLQEIVKYLRFSKGEDGYQAYLKHYLPMLPKEQFDAFVGDVEILVDGKPDKAATKVRLDEITAKWEEKYAPKELTPTPEALEAIAKAEAEREETAKKDAEAIKAAKKEAKKIKDPK